MGKVTYFVNFFLEELIALSRTEDKKNTGIQGKWLCNKAGGDYTGLEDLLRAWKLVSVTRSVTAEGADLMEPLLHNLHLRVQMAEPPSVCQRFLGSNLRVIPVHNTAETVKLMLSIAKITCKPHIDNIRYRMFMAKAQIIDQSPVWKMLHKIQLDCN
ncbi:hypothetical protein KIL84_015973 [Mauremys mutica]|uniref:Uncharacterized protein n=1 Tax=Mauremys mutica TaxID=74926 RepID=A0A9D4ASE4_9SAUR|nr:hypothetical protein KIL84_015973 [Mauremys mutica]